MTTNEKIFNLCIECAKSGWGGYTFNLKDVWQAARKKYKMTKQAVIDAFDVITKEHKVKKGDEEGTFVLVELMPKESELLQIYREQKAKHPKALLLFGCGDFYKTYCDNAIAASQVLGITLTHCNNGADGVKGDAMVVFSRHALDIYLPKLIRAGERVAIVDGQGLLAEKLNRDNCKDIKLANEKKNVKHVLTPCEVINLKAQKKARELYPEQFTRFGFARLDSASGKEFKNADDAIRGKADMNALLYMIKVVDGVQFTGATRIDAYEKFLDA